VVNLGKRVRACGPVRKGPFAWAPAPDAFCVCRQFPYPS